MQTTARHSWTLSVPEAIALQKEMAAEVSEIDRLPSPVKRVAGIDLGYDEATNTCRVAVAVLDFPSLEVVETALATMPIAFPYVPGLLSFREAPAALEALSRLQQAPDLILCDGQGRAHPRRFGIACHLGVLTDIPAIGVAKSVLIGKFATPAEERGSHSPMIHRGETVGAALRTRTGVQPLYISVGHHISLPTALDYVLRCTPKYRLPETTRQADHLASFRKQ